MHTIDQELEVYVSPAGQVCIARRDMNEDCSVAIAPEEVDLLIDWLKEKKSEAIARRGASVPDTYVSD
jgi:hypothetical protein